MGFSPSAIEPFEQALTGRVILPGQPDYERARRVWNGLFDCHPAIVVRCRTTEDVANTVIFARQQNLPVAVRGGSHSLAGFSTCDDGLVIDLSQMYEVKVDPDRKVAVVAGGAVAGDLDKAAQAVGLVCPLGDVSHTGIGGLTLGGGIGGLSRKYGLTLDSLLGAEVVIANGTVLQCDEQNYSDLFWALRGGGGNFGVVTQFKFALHSLNSPLNTAVLGFSLDQLPELTQFFSGWPLDASDDLAASLVVHVALDDSLAPADLVGKPYMSLGMLHAGGPENFKAALEPLLKLNPVFESVDERDYLELQQEKDTDAAWGQRNYWSSVLLTSFPSEVAEICVDYVVKQPHAASAGWAGVAVSTLGGQIARIPQDATAFSGRDAAFYLHTDTVWIDSKLDNEYIAWTKSLIDALKPYAHHSNYINALSERVDAQTIYATETYKRLVEVKRTYDPTNLFRFNQNIDPTG